MQQHLLLRVPGTGDVQNINRVGFGGLRNGGFVALLLLGGAAGLILAAISGVTPCVGMP